MVEIPTICRYCGGAVHLVPAAKVYGPAAAKRLGLEREKFYQCQNCNARVGCHKGSARPLGNLANAQVSMNTVDIGLAQLAMHSSYETAGCADVDYMIRALAAFYQTNIASFGDGEYQLG